MRYLICLLLAASALGQQVFPPSGGSGSGVTSVSSLPATCTPPKQVYLTTGVVGYYNCTGTNVWSMVGRTTYFWQGAYQSGMSSFAANLPVTNAPAQLAGVITGLVVTAGTGGNNGTAYALTFTGGCVTAPTGTVDVVGGAWSNAVLLTGGTGCTSAPVVTCASCGGSGSITATLATVNIGVLSFSAGQSAQYAWWTSILPAGYATNSPITYTIESRSWDSTNYVTMTASLACSHQTLTDPTFVAAPTFNITHAASNYQTLTTGTITPNSGGLPVCAAGDRFWLKLTPNANVGGHVMTSAFHQVSLKLSVPGVD